MLTIPTAFPGASALPDVQLALAVGVLGSAQKSCNGGLEQAQSNNLLYRFGHFELSPMQRVLRRDGQPVRIGSRALDILIALVENAGQLVAKTTLVRCAWPTTIVDETNLRVQLTSLRKLLGANQEGEPFIVTVAGQGYWFAARDLRAGAASSRLSRREIGDQSI